MGDTFILTYKIFMHVLLVLVIVSACVKKWPRATVNVVSSYYHDLVRETADKLRAGDRMALQKVDKKLQWYLNFLKKRSGKCLENQYIFLDCCDAYKGLQAHEENLKHMGRTK